MADSHSLIYQVFLFFKKVSDNDKSERFPVVAENELDEQRSNKQNKNTFKCTETSLNIYNEWSNQRRETP